MKHVYSFLMIISSVFFLFSCNNDDDSLLRPSIDQIAMEGEGGETKVSLPNGEWKIAGIVNKNADVNIFGDIFSLEGERVKENTALTLEGLGKLEALWGDKGFIITRDDPTSLTIQVEENATGEPFSFAVVLQAGEETKEIIVKQDKSEGYAFDKIEYTVKEDDGDSLYWRHTGTLTFLNIGQPTKMETSAYGGVDIVCRSWFESSQRDAFVWLIDDSVSVDIPTDLYKNELSFGGDKTIYSPSPSIRPHRFEGMIEIEVPAGDSSFSKELEFYHRKVTYYLTLTNKRTGDKKVIEGKWIEEAPTGKYKIVEN